MTMFVQYIYPHRQECDLLQIARFLIAFLITAYVHVLLFVRVAKKMNKEEERATLQNFVDSSILELLLNETEDDKDIVHTITR